MQAYVALNAANKGFCVQQGDLFVKKTACDIMSVN